MKWTKKALAAMDRDGRVSAGSGRLLSTRYYTGKDFLASAQGITNDGEFFYCAGTVLPLKFRGLSKIDVKTGEVVFRRDNYLPEPLAKAGFRHYGGATYFEKKIYVAVEAPAPQPPCVAVFSADDLSFTGEYHVLGPEVQPFGNLPWCAADKEKRVIYTGFFRGCDFVNVFDIDTFAFKKHIVLDKKIEHAQGGEVYDGIIYLSCHDTWKKKHIYAVDPTDGSVRLVMERDASHAVIESEGVTILKTEDGAFFHQLDVIYPATLAIRSYAFDPENKG